MTEKPPVWGDLLAAGWVICVGVVYFGGYFQPRLLGTLAGSATYVYALMLLVCSVLIALRYLGGSRRSPD